MPLPLIRALGASRLACTRCGSADVHPLQGAFGPVIGLLGIMRYGCRGCRRAFWIRADAEARRPASRSPGENTTAPAANDSPRSSDAALDFEVTPTTHEKVDLTPLDAEFERIRTGGGATKRPSLEDRRDPKPEETRSPRRRKRPGDEPSRS